MATHTNLQSLFTDIADAIRGKTGDTAEIIADDFPAVISTITTGDGVDTSNDTVTPETLVEGYTAHDASGSKITGTNPYEKTETDGTVNTQASLIQQIQAALIGKVAGGGVLVDGETLIVPEGIVEVS